MASIQIRKETNRLIIDFYYRGQHCREQTALDNTAANRKRLEKLLDRIETEIKSGTFDYAKFFPGSRMVLKIAMAQAAAVGSTAAVAAVTPTVGMATPAMTMLPVAAPVAAALPTFAEFAAIWVAENEVAWRRVTISEQAACHCSGCVQCPLWFLRESFVGRVWL
jgi:integrase